MRIFFVSLLFLSNLYGAENSVKPVETKESKWEKLNRMIDKEEKFIKTIRNRGPRLQWRLLELQTERLKLIKEKENHRFLNASFKLRKQHKKDWFFSESRSYELQIRTKGLNLIKTWPRYKYNSDIYYTLGLNSRDYNKGKQTEYFFKLALKHAQPGSHIIYLASVGLAEYYYNEKKYNSAVSYYVRVIKNREDEWHSKHLYNLSWCYLKTGKYQKAISHAEQAHTLSKNKEYIDVSDQIYDSIGLFYVMGKREKDGAEFYLTNVDKPAQYIIKMSQKMANEGHYQKADYLLNKALDHSISQNQSEEEIKIRLAYLDFYRNFKKFEEFFVMSKALEKIYIEKPYAGTLHDQVIEKIEGLVGYLQVRLTRNSKIKITDYSKPLLDRVLAYFDILAVINKKKTDFYRFYQGETYFAVSEIKPAFFKYQASLEFNKMIDLKKDDGEQKHTGLRVKLMNSLLACLEETKFEDKHVIYTYQNHIDLYPVNPISQQLYSKLFNIHMKRKDPPKAIISMEVYNKNYPGDLKIQQAMLIKLIDFYILGKNTDQLAFWINKLETGYFSFGKDYIKQATNVLGEILFHDYTKLAAKGLHHESIEGNKKLFENPKYPKIIHAQAASKIALSYLHLKQADNAVNWTITSVPLYKEQELKKRLPQLKASIERLVILQDLRHAIKLSDHLFNHFCTKSEPLKEYLYDQIFSLNLVEQNYKEAYLFISKKSIKCGIGGKKENESLLSYINYIHQHDKSDILISLFKKYVLSEKRFLDIIPPMLMNKYWNEYLKDDLKGESKNTLQHLMAFQKKFPKEKISAEILKIDQFNKFKITFGNKKFKPFIFGTEFNEEKYNTELTSKFNKLKTWVDETVAFTTHAPYPIVITTLKMIHQKHLQLAEVIRNATPPGMEGEYLKSFKQAMATVASNIITAGNEYFAQGNKLLTNSYDRSNDNTYFLNTSPTYKKIKMNYPMERYSLSFDQYWGDRKPASVSSAKTGENK